MILAEKFVEVTKARAILGSPQTPLETFILWIFMSGDANGSMMGCPLQQRKQQERMSPCNNRHSTGYVILMSFGSSFSSIGSILFPSIFSFWQSAAFSQTVGITIFFSFHYLLINYLSFCYLINYLSFCSWQLEILKIAIFRLFPSRQTPKIPSSISTFNTT